MKWIARGIVRSRFVIFLLFGLAAVYCALSIGRVRVSNDLTTFLPPQTETRQGLTIMENEFAAYTSEEIMLANVTYEIAASLTEKIGALPCVTSVSFDDTPAHFTGTNALLSILYSKDGADPGVKADMRSIREIIAPYDHYISGNVLSDYTQQLASEMGSVLLIAAIVIFAVLLLTSRSYFEVVIFTIVFVFAALLNMGTNFWLGEISSITNSIAVIMQLALAIDYAIIFAHRYQDEADRFASSREAVIEALSKAIVEIASSSLTTISGLAALTLMQFRLGYDLGIVLSKGIICSMLTVFLLMPGLILLFPRALKRTLHKNLIPSIEPWGRFLMRTKLVFVVIFLLALPFAIYCANHAPYAFSDSAVDELIYSESRAAMHRIHDTFAPSTPVAVLLPAGDFESEKKIVSEIQAMPEVKSATGLASIKIDSDHVLTDSYNPRMLSSLLDIDYEQALLLFQAYGLEHAQYQAIFGSGEYSVPLVDMLLYLFEKVDQGFVTLTDSQQEMIGELRSSLEFAAAQMRGENWDRLVLTVSLPVEGEESTAFVERVRALSEQYYGEGTVLVIGDITSSRDLKASYTGDSLLISILTIVFVYIILLFTFRSVFGAAVLVFVIQGSIWINFTFPFLLDSTASFVTNMIVSAIQMGATIDYAIVIMSRFQALRSQYPKREAMAKAVSESFPTVMTSGAIMTAAGFLIALRVSDVYVGHIGLAVGRGALISMILVLTVLPQMIVLFDKWIEKTTIRLKIGEGGEKE